MLKYKQNRKLTTVKCDFCGIDVEKPLSEVNRNRKFNKHLFCSRSCSIRFNCANRTEKMTAHSNSIKNKEHLLKVSLTYNLYEMYPEKRFSYYLRNCRKRFKECTLTLEDLQNQWDKQNGICPYSGIKLQIASYTKNHNNFIYTASVDRIDSNQGYAPENIQFVSTAINLMKSTMSDLETKFLCKCIAENFFSDRTISSSDNQMSGAQAGN